jgi:hypothetical protein
VRPAVVGFALGVGTGLLLAAAVLAIGLALEAHGAGFLADR